MKTLLQRLFVLALVIGFIQACNEPLVEEQTMDDMELKSAQNGKISYIVVLNDEELNSELVNLKGYEKRQQVAKKAAEKVMNRAGVTDGELGFVYGTAIKGFSVKIPPGQLKKLENDPSVKYVEEDQIITLIEPTAKPGDITIEAAQEVPYGITRVNGGATYNGDKVVWVIDTGIDLDHEDLNVDGSRGWNFISNSLNADDDNGHGSHCAGIIAAIDNAVGVVGVAAGATVIPVKVLDRRGSGSTSGVIAGVNWVAANGSRGDVANMSLGGGAYDPLDDAVLNASESGIYFSLAAGNESDDANSHSPARVNGDYIYTISAMDINDNWAYFSNYGNPPVDFCEPGYNIYSTYKSGGYATMSGTSMAAPHMAGILVWGVPNTDGNVNGDPDGNADPIGVVSGDVSSNKAPVANAGLDIIATEGELVTLDGSASYDPDVDDVITYQWTSLDGVQLSDANVENPTFTAPQVDTETKYRFSLVVNDGVADSNTDQVIVTVRDSSTPGGDILLDGAITGNKVKKVTLTWTGATGATVTLYINNNPVTVNNSGSYIENLGKITSGTYEYYIVDEANVKSNLLVLSI